MCGLSFLGVFACLFAAWDASPEFFTWFWWPNLQAMCQKPLDDFNGEQETFKIMGVSTIEMLCQTYLAICLGREQHHLGWIRLPQSLQTLAKNDFPGYCSSCSATKIEGWPLKIPGVTISPVDVEQPLPRCELAWTTLGEAWKSFGG